jgi:hypothetical protein
VIEGMSKFTTILSIAEIMLVWLIELKRAWERGMFYADAKRLINSMNVMSVVINFIKSTYTLFMSLACR